MIKSNKKRAHMRGILAIEMAFSLPVLLLFILASIEVGRFFWSQHWLNINLYQAIKSHSLDSSKSVKNYLLSELEKNNLFFNPSNIDIEVDNLKLFPEDEVKYKRYKAIVTLKLMLMPIQSATISSVSWSIKDENIIR